LLVTIREKYKQIREKPSTACYEFSFCFKTKGIIGGYIFLHDFFM